MKNDTLLNELLNRQLKDVPMDKKLRYTDLKRLCKYIDSSIFDENVCSMWSGYVTNGNNESKGVYINFYYKGKKAALHRLLYVNFIGELQDDEYLKFACVNRGKCCNIHHLKKFKYSTKDEKPIKTKKKNRKKSRKNILNMSNDFTLTFD